MESAPEIRVLIVDDHELIRESLIFVLKDEKEIEVTGSAATGEDALEATRTSRPDVVLMDFLLPDADGAEVTKKIKSLAPETKVVMLTGATSDDVLVKAIESGCSGFVTKERAVDEIVSAVRAAHAGEALISPSMLARVLPKLSRIEKPAKPLELSTREHQVLTMLARGLRNQEVAEELGLSLYTVRNHIQSVLIKMQAHSKMEAVATALRDGLIEVAE